MTESNLTKSKCTVCGKKLQISKRQSHKAGKKLIGYCFAGTRSKQHKRLKFTIIDEATPSEPDADHMIDVKIEDSDQ